MSVLYFLIVFISGIFSLWIAMALAYNLSLIVMYFSIWTEKERKMYCPHGLLACIFGSHSH